MQQVAESHSNVGKLGESPKNFSMQWEDQENNGSPCFQSYHFFLQWQRLNYEAILV